MGRDGQVRNDTWSLNLKMSLGQGEDAKLVRVEIFRWREVRFKRAHRALEGLDFPVSASGV